MKWAFLLCLYDEKKARKVAVDELFSIPPSCRLGLLPSSQLCWSGFYSSAWASPKASGVHSLLANEGQRRTIRLHTLIKLLLQPTPAIDSRFSPTICTHNHGYIHITNQNWNNSRSDALPSTNTSPAKFNIWCHHRLLLAEQTGPATHGK